MNRKSGVKRVTLDVNIDVADRKRITFPKQYP
jgi:hypothetical protein